MLRAPKKTNIELAHDALHGIVDEAISPISGPPPAQSFMNEAEFKRHMSRKIPVITMPTAKSTEDYPEISGVEDLKVISRLNIVRRQRMIKNKVPIYTALTAKSQTHQSVLAPLTDNAPRQSFPFSTSTKSFLIRTKSALAPQRPSRPNHPPQIATFSSDRPPLPPSLKRRSAKKTYSFIPPHLAAGVPNLADCLVKWQQEVGGSIIDLLRVEYWTTNNFGTKPFLCAEQSHTGLQRVQKVEIDIPIVKEVPGLCGKWTFIT